MKEEREGERKGRQTDEWTEVLKSLVGEDGWKRWQDRAGQGRGRVRLMVQKWTCAESGSV